VKSSYPKRAARKDTTKIALGITGASGAIYGVRLLQALVDRGWEIALCVSGPGQRLLREELAIEFDPQRPPWEKVLGNRSPDGISVYPEEDIGAPPASGGTTYSAYVICPCSMGTIGRIASGISDTLITRMADVALKEGRTLVLVPRETPYSTIHLRNMLALSETGAVILPASPGFYTSPTDIDDLVDFVVARILQHLGL
jgi:4-hydroxy-3-polyprenylbenzoate decarboxylase